MRKMEKTTNLLTRLIVTFVFVAQFSDTALALSDKRLCADEKCHDIISWGTGTINYPAGEEGMVSFKINSPIRIKSKSAGKDPSLWGIEVNGREGYAPKQFIRENRVIISEKKLKYVVDVKSASGTPVLNSSENVVGQEATVEITTKPLDEISVESKEEPISKKPVENASTEKPAVATPVLMEMVDGTQIPIMVDGAVEVLKEDEKLAEDDEIGDYDDDEEDVNLEIDEASKPKKEIMTSGTTQENNENTINSDKTSEPVKSNHLTSSLLVDIKQDVSKPKKEHSTLSLMKNNEIMASESSGTTQEINENKINSDDTNEPVELNHLTSSLPVDIKQDVFNSNSAEILPPSEILNIVEGDIKQEESTESFPASEILNEVKDDIKQEEYNADSKSTGSWPPPESLIEVPQPNDKDVNETSKIETNSEEVDKNLPLNNLTYSSKEELQIETLNDLPIQQQTTVNETKTQEPTLTTTEQAINDNLKVAVEHLTTTQENQQQVPTETTETLEENTVNDNTTEASDTDNDQGSIINDNKLNTQSLPDYKPSEGVKAEENVSLVNQKIVIAEERLVSDPFQQYNKEISTEPSETLKYDQTENMHINKKSSFYAKPTTQTESPVVEQITTETVTIPQNSMENLQQMSEFAINTQTKQSNTEAQLNEENEIPQTNTGSPSSILGNDPNQQKVTESPSSSSPPILSRPQHQQTNNESPPSTLENDPYQQTSTESASSTPSPISNYDPYQQQPDSVNPTPYNPYDDAPSNTPLPPHYDSPPPSQITEIPQYDYYDQQPTGYAPSDFVENEIVTENPKDPYHDQSSVSYGSAEHLQTMANAEQPASVEEEPKALSSLTSPFNEDIGLKENKGLFATIMGTVNNMLSSNMKTKHEEHGKNDELHKILFSDRGDGPKTKHKADNIQYCEKLGPNGDCPHAETNPKQRTEDCDCSFAKSIFSADLTFETFIQALASKILEISELLAFLAVVAAASLFFIFGYYCFCNSSREGALLSKLNQLESSLLATHKENAILKHNLMSTRQKLASIEDNSFGSNDMVVSLKKELEDELMEKARLQEQISNLQKELENAADAGIELNKIVSELLSNQTGDESIISSVEELQKQLNEQQNTILEINASLAEKSRENSELQLLIAEQNARYESEIANLQRDNDELEQEKGNLQTRLDDIRSDFDKDITAALEGKNFEIKRLQNEIVEWSIKIENEHTKWQTSMAKVEALEECLKNVKRDPNVNITQVIDVANVRAELLDAQKKYTTVKERLEMELDSRKLAENQLQIVSAEVEVLKQDFNQSEKDKLEAQTRLEVLSNYFKDKENQLQKELSLKEAMWLKQQGETTTTVDRLTAMQEEIQSLKSQNDSLRAEIEAQVAAHKAQTGTLENRAHETWLAARQSDRRYEEARAEATALRRKLTALAGGNVNEANKPSAGSAGLGEELTNAPSPIHMETPGSPMLGRMPPPPFLPPPFMGPPPPFMGMPPPPPFVPAGEMRPAPLGRIMSPPPQRSGRFSPQHLDYEDYLDYEGNNTWHRHTYSPTPRTYRSLSPTDSRYNYDSERDLMSKYDAEIDYSPPPSPRESRRRGGGGGNGSERGSNDTRSPYNNSKKSNSGNKGLLSSGSEKSYNSSPQHAFKTRGGNAGGSNSFV